MAHPEIVTAGAVAHAASRYMTTTQGVALILSRLKADLADDDRDGVCVWAEEVAFLQQTSEDANQEMHGLIQAWTGNINAADGSLAATLKLRSLRATNSEQPIAPATAPGFSSAGRAARRRYAGAFYLAWLVKG